MPGCGKSTAGRQLSRHLGWRFVDSDAEIETEIGDTIRSFFDKHGEESFRDVEQRAIARLSVPGPMVLATGGGAVLRPANREAMMRPGNQVVYLRATPEHLYERVRQDRNRPLLAAGDPLERLRALYRERDALYREVADLVIDTGRQSVQVLARALLERLGALWKASA